MKKKTLRVLACTYTVLLVLFTVYAALDTFVIPHRMTAVAYEESTARIVKTPHGQSIALSGTETEEEVQSAKTVEESETATATEDTEENETATAADNAEEKTRQEALSIDGTVVGTYDDGETLITITQIEAYDTDIYVADILLSSADALRTALAGNVYGRNVKEETSVIADDNQAILAINGDFYGSRTEGYVIRNGVLYRDTAGNNREGLAIMEDGSFLTYLESEIGAQELLSQGAVQAFSFGPALLQDGAIAVTENEEVGKAKASNPRTALGVVDDLHYVFVVSDGRTDASEGLSLYQLAQVMESIGVQDAYNLDGGGSSTMVFQGEVINNPTTSGKNTREREVSDIVYIGR